MKVRRGDTVQVISGDESGKRGRILKVFPKRERAIVEGVNFVKKHARTTRSGQPGGIVEKEAPIHLSNLQLVCPGCGKPTRAGIETGSDGSKSRVCKKCGEVVER